MFVIAPFLTLVAIAAGGVATVVTAILNGPRALRRRPDPPMVIMPPVPTPEMQMLIRQQSEPELVEV